jgi:hypothetical protein
MISVRDKDRIDTEYRDFSNIHFITVYLESTFCMRIGRLESPGNGEGLSKNNVLTACQLTTGSLLLFFAFDKADSKSATQRRAHGQWLL